MSSFILATQGVTVRPLGMATQGVVYILIPMRKIVPRRESRWEINPYNTFNRDW